MNGRTFLGFIIKNSMAGFALNLTPAATRRFCNAEVFVFRQGVMSEGASLDEPRNFVPSTVVLPE